VFSLWQQILNISDFGCHQLPERSFYFRGKQFPVCARCTGLIFGQSIAVMTAVIAGYYTDIKLTAILSVPMALDWSAQEFLKILSTNRRRLVTGLFCGVGLGSMYAYLIKSAYLAIFN
jgi:uncharacterized membrane protein